jgi:hypothetical protein
MVTQAWEKERDDPAAALPAALEGCGARQGTGGD